MIPDVMAVRFSILPPLLGFHLRARYMVRPALTYAPIILYHWMTVSLALRWLPGMNVLSRFVPMLMMRVSTNIQQFFSDNMPDGNLGG